MPKKSDRYTLPIDAIITIPPTNPLAFMANKLGFKIGANSKTPCIHKERERWTWAFDLSFLDCDFKKYQHEKHLQAAQLNNPKYCIVRDIMTEQQCQEIGADFYELDQILMWANELESYCQHIIIVPKFDCLSDIPSHYVIGRAMSRYGKFHLPMDLLEGRKIHLLGGGWKKQRNFLLQYKDQIVSFDHNNIWRVSVYGNFTLPDGTMMNLRDFGFDVTSPMYSSMILSLNHIARELHRIYNGEIETKENNQLRLF